MSFLLDALRKSEAQRRLGEVPTLSAIPTPAARGRDLSRAWLLSLVAVLALGLAGFLAWRELTGPPAESEPMAQATREIVSTEREPAPAGAPPQSPADETDDAHARISEAAQRRRQAWEERQEARAPEPQSPEPLAEPPAEEPPDAAGPDPAAPAPGIPPAAEPFTPVRREYVQRWELPAAVRSDLPELNIMAHIYSDEPENRFILMNGRRYVEGDSLGGGATLAEIRREGAVVDFREYRFLVE